jgi:hypothetical protein
MLGLLQLPLAGNLVPFAGNKSIPDYNFMNLHTGQHVPNSLSLNYLLY